MILFQKERPRPTRPATEEALKALSLLLVLLALGCETLHPVATLRQTNADRWRDDPPNSSWSENSSADPQHDSQQYPRQRSGLNAALAVWAPLRPTFHLEGINDEWDRSSRVELQLSLHSERDIQVETVTGGYLYYEEKSWKANGGRADFESFGAGMEVGALLHPFTYEGGAAVDVAFFPFLRYGLGSAGGRFRDIPTTTAIGAGFSRGDFGDFRVEGGIGADLRVLFSERFTLAVGAGVNWWDTLDTALVEIRNGSGTVLVNEDETRFDGRDTYFRITFDIAY